MKKGITFMFTMFKGDQGEYCDRQFGLMRRTPKEGSYINWILYCWVQLINKAVIPVGRMYDSVPPRPSGAARIYP
jgi:hypothetical protein